MMPQNWAGKTIGGRYQVEDLLGQGGMSAVYRANDPNLRRLVAIKIIHAHLSADPNFIGRFKEEAAAVARLRHPNIVQVHDFNSDGEIYYMVMEYLVGETLQKRLKRLNAASRRMPLDEALDLCIQLCEAAGYAHNHELVHRDIKPANIMLNVNGQAILMDFGIVKILGGDYHTATGATLGTAMYMSPEQIRAERIDDRADIYSLGVTLYEMLSGQPPYTADSALSLMMMVLNDPLPDLGQTCPGIPEGLLRVVMKALAKQPAERYQTMAEMAADLRQVRAALANSPPEPAATVADEPVIRPAGPATIVDDPTDENIGQAEQVALPASESRVANLQESAGRFSQATSLQDEKTAEPYPQSKSASLKDRFGFRLRLRRILPVGAGILVLAVVIVLGWMYLNARRPPEIKLQTISSPSEHVNAESATSVVSLGRWETGSSIEELTYSPDGSLIGTANNREWARFSPYRYYAAVWNTATGSLQYYFPEHSLWVYDVAFSPNNELFGSVSDDGSLLLWKTADGELVHQIESGHGGLTSLDFSSNGLLLATGSWDGIVSLLQVDNGNLLRTLQDDDFSIQDVAFSPDGNLLAAASDNNAVLIWEVSDGKLAHTLQAHTAPVKKVAFSADGALLASASDDYNINIWQVSDGALLQSLSIDTEAVYDVAFSPDGSVLASGSGDGNLRLWQVSDGALLSTLTEYSDSITCVQFSPDGSTLISGGEDGVVQFWGISEAIPMSNE